MKALANIAYDPSFDEVAFKWLVDILNGTFVTTNRRPDTVAISASHRRLDKQIKVLYEDRLDGRISSETYDLKFKEKTAERDEIAKQIKRLSSENTEYIERAIDILELTQNAAEIFRTKPVDAQRVLLGDIFSNIK